MAASMIWRLRASICASVTRGTSGPHGRERRPIELVAPHVEARRLHVARSVLDGPDVLDQIQSARREEPGQLRRIDAKGPRLACTLDGGRRSVRGRETFLV